MCQALTENLLNKVPSVPKCLNSQVLFKGPSGQVPKCSSALSTRVPKSPSSARVSRVPLECPSSVQVTFEFSSSSPLSTLWVKKVWNITRNIAQNITRSGNFSKQIFYAPLVFWFLWIRYTFLFWNKMCKLYQFC